MKGKVEKYKVCCFTSYGALLHTFHFNCKSGEKARSLTRKELYKMGKQPNRMAIVASVMEKDDADK